MEAMADKFTTPVWAQIRNKNSELCSLLLKHISYQDDASSYDYQKLMLLGILYCVDRSKPFAKAKEFYGVLQDGGFEKQPHINAMDKDWLVVCNSLFTLATLFAAEGSDQKQCYDETQRKVVCELMKYNESSAFSAVLGL